MAGAGGGDLCAALRERSLPPHGLNAHHIVHDRIPVILRPDRYNLWLDPGATNVQMILELLQPYDAQFMPHYPVSSRINHVSNDEPGVLACRSKIFPTRNRTSGAMAYAD